MKKSTKKLVVVGGVAVGAYLVGKKLFASRSAMAGFGVDTSGVVVGSASAPSLMSKQAPLPVAVVGGTSYGQDPFGKMGTMAVVPKTISPLIKYGIPAVVAAGLIYWFLLRKKS